jgi:hypothetical protein
VKTWNKCKFIYKSSIQDIKKKYEKENIKIEQKYELEKKNLKSKIENEIELNLISLLKKKNISFIEFVQFKLKYLENMKTNNSEVDLELRNDINYHLFKSLIQ